MRHCTIQSVGCGGPRTLRDDGIELFRWVALQSGVRWWRTIADRGVWTLGRGVASAAALCIGCGGTLPAAALQRGEGSATVIHL